MLASKGQAKSLQSLFPRFPFKKNAFPFLALQPACRDGSKKIQDGSKHFFSGGLSSAVCTRQFSHANFHNWALGLHTLICTLAEFKVLGCPAAPHCAATSLLGVWWFAAFQQYCCATVVMKGTPWGGGQLPSKKKAISRVGKVQSSIGRRSKLSQAKFGGTRKF